VPKTKEIFTQKGKKAAKNQEGQDESNVWNETRGESTQKRQVEEDIKG